MVAHSARRPLLAVVPPLLLAALAAPPAAAQLVPVGEPISAPRPGHVVLAADGRFALVWTEGGAGALPSLWMAAWSWDGERLVPPLRLDAERPLLDAAIAVGAAPDGSGDFVVAWAADAPGRFAYREASVDGLLAPVQTLVLPVTVQGLPAVALGPAGALSWAWRELVGPLGDPHQLTRIKVRPFGGTTGEVGGDAIVERLRLAVSAAGVLWLAWEHTPHPEHPPAVGFAAFGLGWGRWASAFQALPPARASARVAVDGARALLVVDSVGTPLDDDGADGACSGVFAEPSTVDAARVGPEVSRVNPRPAGCQVNAAAEGSSTGGFLVVWRSLQGRFDGDGDSSQDGLWLRTYGSEGQPLGDPLRIAGDEGPAAADYESGRAVVATGSALHRFAAPPVACAPGAAHLCLGGGRFRVEADQRNPYPPFGQGAGRALPLTADTGAFWFFHPANLELMLKVLDGRVVNERWWVFSAGLTTVEHWIMVFDGATGGQALYHNPPFAIGGRADTAAFTDGAGAEPAGGAPQVLRLDARAATCNTDPTVATVVPACDDPRVLCLQDGRFALSVAWRDPRSGDEGLGRPRPVTGDTGAFWFFHPANLELMVKVLDARPLDGHWWVFSGSLSDVEHTLEVVDRATGLVRRYTNAPYTLGSHADTAAFSDDP